MSQKRVQFSNIVQNQLPEYVKTDYPLISEFLKQYYIGQEYVSGPLDLIQNIDQYTKVDEFTNLNEKVGLSEDITSYDDVIPVNVLDYPKGTNGFPSSYGLIKIGNEVITYTGTTPTTFTGCIRGFSGVTSYKEESDPETLVFESTNAQSHEKGSFITNLSCLFLKEFLLKTKYQILPGLEDRELSQNINKNLFIKQSKDFYTSKGTDRSFEILFKALYEEDVKIIRPRDFLFTPSNANYIITNDLIVESIEGNVEDLQEATLYQDGYEYDANIQKAYAPISKIEKISPVGGGQTYYKFGFDAGYNKDVRVEGSIYGDFKVHPKTRLIGEVVEGSNTINVDSTVGFGNTGELYVVYSDSLKSGIVSYTSKSLTQFYGCTNVVGIISDKSSIGINTFAWGYSFKDQTEKIKVRIDSVLSNVEYPDNTTYYGYNNEARIKTLGISDTSFKAKNWFYNIASSHKVKEIIELDESDDTYEIITYNDHQYNPGDFVQFFAIDGTPQGGTGKILQILTKNSFRTRAHRAPFKLLDYQISSVQKNISQVNSNSFPEANIYSTNVQNVYKEKYNNNYLIASPSIPTYNTQPLDASDRSITISGTYSGEELDIGLHTFYTGDSVYYIPQKELLEYYSGGSLYEQLTVVSSLFKSDLGELTEGDIAPNEGLYFVKRISSTKIKLAKSKGDIYKSNFITVGSWILVGEEKEVGDVWLPKEGEIKNNIFQVYDLRLKTLESQKLLRKILPPKDNNTRTETVPGYNGILVNGVEILNYKSEEVIFYGKIDSIDVLDGGSDYDIINPPPFIIKDVVGTGATGIPAISGSLNEIRVIDPGFDYDETPLVKIEGGNGKGATVDVRMALVDHKADFNSQEVGIGTTVSTIGFSTYHKFRNAEKVIYITNNQKAISGLTTDSIYYVSHVDNTTVKLYPTKDDVISGINTIMLLAEGVGKHSLKSYNKKSIVDGINVTNGGSGYQNKKRTTFPIGVSTASNEITIENHGYKTGEIVKYTTPYSGQSPIGGITNGSEYYVTKISDDIFKLSTSKDLCDTKQYIDFTAVGVGTHVFNYQDITVSLVGKVGISSIGLETFEAQIQPIFRGQITSVHLQEKGVGYGSSDIIDYKREPEILMPLGSNAQTQVIAYEGVISEILILNGGSNYNSIPDLNLNGDGYGAILTPIIENGVLTEVKIISGGSSYTSDGTTLTVLPVGLSAKFQSNIQTWRINLFQKYFDSFTPDDGIISNGINSDYGLQYSHFYAPRPLRESIYSVEQGGQTLYGYEDLRKNNGKEIDNDQHSPIIGWAYDGNPIYGPYGYSTNNGGVVKQIQSGYREEAQTKVNRPSIDIFKPGFFVEDYTYYNVSDESILDENNGRFGITPEFPNGTYAYFATFENTGPAEDGPFQNYKIPAFPYFIGNTFNSTVSVNEDFNYRLSSNQDSIDLSNSNWIRNTQPYNMMEDKLKYKYVNIPDDLDQRIRISNVVSGTIDSVGIVTGGDFYRVNDSLVFNNEDTRGMGASMDVSKILGKSVTNVSVATSTISDVEIYPADKRGEYIIFSDKPHNFLDADIIEISGLSTTSSNMGGSYTVGINTNILSLSGIGTTDSIGITSAGATGIVTYFNVSGNVNYPDIRENDILEIGSEKVKVLNVDSKLSRIRVLREYDGTVGEGHTVGSLLYEEPRKLTINPGLKTTYDSQVNRQIYFNPSDSVGLGSVSGVGIGTTISFANPGTGISEIFIPTQTIYIPNHGLKLGDKLTYSPNNGGGITYLSSLENTAVGGIGSFVDGQTLYAAPVNSYLIGISTIKVGLGSTGGFVGIASTQRTYGTLYFTGIGTGVYHSFKTNYEPLTAKINRYLVNVSTSQTHGLTNNDNVYIDVNPSIASTFVVKYNDYNRRVLVGIKTFSAAGVNTTTNTITLNDHDFSTGEKIVYTATTPIEGLINDGIYYIIKIDSDNFKLSDTYYNSIQPIPSIVGLKSTSDGNIGPINPSLKLYKNSNIVFDLSDPSLSYSKQSAFYSAFEFNFYEDSDYEKLWFKDTNIKNFSVVKFKPITDADPLGRVGIDTNAKVTLIVDDNLPEILYYRLDPIHDEDLPKIKEEVIVDTETNFNLSEVQIKDSLYNGKHLITTSSPTSFTYNLKGIPERVSYASSIDGSNLLYETDSLSALGPIKECEIRSKGTHYYSLPGITTVSTVSGKGADIVVSSKSLGEIKKVKIDNIGFDFPSDKTLIPSLGLPQILKIEPLNCLSSITATSSGRGYISAPKLLVFDGKTNELNKEVDLKYSIDKSKVSILRNAYGLYNAPPTILPINNSNGVGIGTITYNSSTKDVKITLSVGFSTENSFPFAVNDKVMIEGVSVGVGSTGIGYNSEDYNYKLFTITEVSENLGGIGDVTYSLDGDFVEGTFPGTYDAVESSGRIIPQKYFPTFNVVLTENDYEIGETVEQKVYLGNRDIAGETEPVLTSLKGKVDEWDSKSLMLTISSNVDFIVDEKVIGYTSKNQGIASSIRAYESYVNTDIFSKVENGWRSDSGVLNDTMQRFQDSDYYQNFSYSLKSKVTYDDWNDVVSSLNHTLGFKKFSDYQLESSTSNLINVGVSSLTDIEIINILEGVVNLNCVDYFDLVRENSLMGSSGIFSTEIIFANRILQDYSESVGNRVIEIDDISSQFNSHPRPTAYSVVDSFLLSEMRAKKYFILVQDQEYYLQRQLMIVDLLHDNSNAYLNQYARMSTVYDQGSFDFKIDGSSGQLLFYPTKYAINDYWVTSLSYNLDDNILGVGSMGIGGLVLVDTESASVSAGTTTTVVSIADTYSSAKVLAVVNPDISINKEFEFIELNIVHNGTDVAISEYGKLTTNMGDSSALGYGTYYPYLDSSLLKVDFIPNTGIGTTAVVNTVTVGLANSTYSGIGTYQFYHTRLETKTTDIAASGSPTQTIISEYGGGGERPDEYEAAYCLVQVCDLTNNEYQFSEFAVLDNAVPASSGSGGDSYDLEFGNVETLTGIGTLGSRPASSGSGTIEIVFTPEPNIDVKVNIFMQSMTYSEEPEQEIDFNNGTLRSGFSLYRGTERDIKRSFGLTYREDPIFERYFEGNNSDIVSVGSSTISIPNHFYVTGEKIKYHHVGTASSAIGIGTTTFAGIGSTSFLPEELFVIKIDDELIQIASSAEKALKIIPEALEFTSVGIGTSHRFVATNQNVKMINAIDNLIQSPITSTAVTTTLANNVLITDTLVTLSGITSFFASDLIRMGDEIMKIESIGVAATNVMRVRRGWVGTKFVEHQSGDLVTKVVGNYNISDNVLSFTEAPHGNKPIGSITNPPDDRDWTGISTSSTYQGRFFMKSGIVGQSTDTYSDNYLFDDISGDFNATSNEFTLKSNGSNVIGITTQTIVLVNDILQERGLTQNYTINQSSGISTITFIGDNTPLRYDVGISSYPVGGVIVSVGSTEGLGYQPLVAAGGTAKVSTAGTISYISIGYSGSGYRSGIGQTVNVSIKQESIANSNIVSIGTAIIGSNGYITGVAVTNSQVFYAPKTISNVGYNSITGMSTVTTSTAHGLEAGNEIVLSGISFTCTYSGPKSIAGFAYSAASGIATVTTSGAHGYSANQDVIFTGIGMTCAIDPSTTHTYPRTTDPYYNGSKITSIINSTKFVTNVGISTVETFYVSGGTVQGAIIAPRANNKSSSKSDPAAGQVTVLAVLDDYKFRVQTGISTLPHFYTRGGTIEKSLSVVFDEPLSYSNMPLVYSSSSPVGLGTSAIIDIQVGQGSSIVDFTIRNGGYGYGSDQILTVQTGGATGVPTTGSGFKEFNLTVKNIYTDEFAGWSVGQLQTLDNVERFFDGERTDFPLSVDGEVLSIMAARGSKIDVQNNLIVCVNDVLQVPGLGYMFNGGSIITLSEAPKNGDTIKIMFYRGRAGIDVVEREVLETVKRGDTLTIGYDSGSGQSPFLQEESRTVTLVDRIDAVDTNNYYGPGNVADSNLLRPVKWCKQTEDKIIDEQIISKDRELYEPLIKPTAYITKSVGIGSTTIYVDNLKPFFDPSNESLVTIDFQKKVQFIRQEEKIGAAATAVVSGLGTISSIVISDGGVGYTTALVSIASTVGAAATTQALGSVTISAGTVTGVEITSPGVGYTNTNVPTVLITPPSSKIETNTVNYYEGDSGVIVGVGTTMDSSQPQLIFDLFIPFDSDLRNATLTGTAITLSSLNTHDYFMVFESNTGAASTSITSLDSGGSTTVGIGTSFIDNIYAIQAVENIQKNISGITTYVKRVFVNTSNLMTYGSGITTSDYMGEYSWGKITLDSRSSIDSYTAYTTGGIGTITSGISTSMMVQRFIPLKFKYVNL